MHLEKLCHTYVKNHGSLTFFYCFVKTKNLKKHYAEGCDYSAVHLKLKHQSHTSCFCWLKHTSAQTHISSSCPVTWFWFSVDKFSRAAATLTLNIATILLRTLTRRFMVMVPVTSSCHLKSFYVLPEQQNDLLCF